MPFLPVRVDLRLINPFYLIRMRVGAAIIKKGENVFLACMRFNLTLHLSAPLYPLSNSSAPC